MTKPTKWHVRPAKSQISLGIRPVWSVSSLCTQWIAKDTSFLHADSEDSDQTGRMPRLSWVFAGRTATLLVLSWGGSFGLFLCRTCKLQHHVWRFLWEVSPRFMLFESTQEKRDLSTVRFEILQTPMRSHSKGSEMWFLSESSSSSIFEPRHKKTCLRGLRPGKTRTGLLSYRSYLEAWNFGHRN